MQQGQGQPRGRKRKTLAKEGREQRQRGPHRRRSGVSLCACLAPFQLMCVIEASAVWSAVQHWVRVNKKSGGGGSGSSHGDVGREGRRGVGRPERGGGHTARAPRPRSNQIEQSGNRREQPKEPKAQPNNDVLAHLLSFCFCVCVLISCLKSCSRRRSLSLRSGTVVVRMTTAHAPIPSNQLIGRPSVPTLAAAPTPPGPGLFTTGRTFHTPIEQGKGPNIEGPSSPSSNTLVVGRASSVGREVKEERSCAVLGWWIGWMDCVD